MSLPRNPYGYCLPDHALPQGKRSASRGDGDLKSCECALARIGVGENAYFSSEMVGCHKYSLKRSGIGVRASTTGESYSEKGVKINWPALGQKKAHAVFLGRKMPKHWAVQRIPAQSHQRSTETSARSTASTRRCRVKGLSTQALTLSSR